MNFSEDRHDPAVRTLVEAADGWDWPVLLGSLSDLLRPVLATTTRPPSGLVDAVLASERPDLHDSLADNRKLLDADPALRARLAATGSVGVVRAAMRHGWSLRHRRLALTAARPADHGWYGPEGTVHWLLTVANEEALLAVVGCPFPEMVRHALLAARLTTAERLRALLTLYEIGGPWTPTTELCDLPADLASAVRDATAPGGRIDRLREAVAVFEGTHGAIDELYDEQTPDRAGHLALRDTLDWDLIIEAHGRRPFDDVAAAVLVERADCPDDALMDLYATRSAAVVSAANRVVAPMLSVSPVGGGTAKTIRTLVRRAIEAGLATAALLNEVRPAVAVLEAVRARPDSDHAADGWRKVMAELEKAVNDRIGMDVEAWRAVRDRLKKFPGTVMELLATPPPGKRGGGGWPDAAALPDLTKQTSISGARAAFVALLDTAPTDVHLALLPHLDERTIYDLLTHGRWRDGWTEHVVTHGPAAARLALASRGGLRAEAITRLMTLDDPEINGLLLHRVNATRAQRARLLSQRPCGVGRVDPVPLDPAYRKRALDKTGGWASSDAVDCADLEVQRHIMRHVRVRGETAQLRLLLNVWERHGPDEVAALIDADLKPVNYTRNPFLRGTKSVIRRLLRMRRREEALAKLRTLVTGKESATEQIALLRADRADHSTLFREAHDWRWDELLEEHRREPFPEVVVGMMARTLRDCPEQFREEGRRALLPWESKQEEALVMGATAEEVAGGSALAWHYHGNAWILRAVAAERITWEVLARHTYPVYAFLLQEPLSEQVESRRRVLSAILDEYLDGDADAFALVLRLLPEFHGTLPELLRTAVAVAQR